MRKITGVVISFVSFLIGRFDLMLKVLLTVMVIDYLTGVACGIVNKNLSSKAGFYGIIKKLSILSVICLSHLAGEVVGVSELRTIAISFYIGNEAISILENSAKMGIPFPEKIKSVLKQLEKK